MAADRSCYVPAAGAGIRNGDRKPGKLNPGDVVIIPAGVKHWHGAAKDCWFSHVAVEIPGEDTANEWCEPVDDEQYRMLR